MHSDSDDAHSLPLDNMQHIAVQGYNAQRRIIYWNHASEQLYGYRAEEALGQALEDLIIPESIRQQVIEAVDNWVINGTPVPTGSLILQHKNGSPVPVLSSHAMQTGHAGPEMYCIDVDLNAPSQSSYQVILRAIVADAPLSDILADIVHAIERNVPGVRCSILQVSDDGKRLYTAAAPSLPAEYNQAINGLSIAAGNGTCGTAAFYRQRIITTDIDSDPAWQNFRTVAAEAGVRSCWSEPVLSRHGEVLATFAMYHDRPISPSSNDLTTIHTAANLTSLAIERVRYAAALQRRNELQEIVSHISTQFLSLPMARIDEGVRWALQHLGQFTHSARCCLILLSEDCTEVIRSYEWCAPGSASRIEDLKTLVNSQLHHALHSRDTSPPHTINNYVKLPELSPIEFQRIQQGHLPTTLGIPIVYDGHLHGFLGMDELNTQRHWHDPELRLLQTAATIIGAALARQALEVRLSYEANHDTLTGVFNRRWFQNVLDHEIRQSERYQREFALILFDIDHFKLVNDQHGHHAGDRVLCQLVELITQRIRSSDVLARWGGEEFIVLLPETSRDNARRIAEMLRCAVEQENFKIIRGLTISLGIAYYETGDKAEPIIKRADTALYAAKHQGRNRSIVQSR